MQRTMTALLSRGLDSDKAKELSKRGWTIKKLKQASKKELLAAHLSEAEIVLLQAGQRPPIPSDTLVRVLFANRFQCCVCRDSNKAFIIHHIVEWHKSRSHDISNLALLCLEHHDQAHAKKALSQNLDERTLRGLKEQWERKVKSLDARSIIDSFKVSHTHWAFINELRLFELAAEYGVDISQIAYFDRAVADGLLDANGQPNPVCTDTFYKYQGPSILTRYGFMKELLNKVIENLAISNISDYLDRGTILPAMVPGDFVFVQGAHTFSPLTKIEKGIGQHCRGSRSANNVVVNFTFDRWEAVSSSSLNDWLVGTKRAGSLLQIKDLRRDNGKIIVTGTALGIASFADHLKTREYAQAWLNWFPSNSAFDTNNDGTES